MSVKRLPCSYAKPEVPNLDFDESNLGRLLSAKFMPYAISHEPDIALSNGSIDFLAHKQILSQISTKMKTILEDDPSAKAIYLRDVADGTIAWLQEFIYFNGSYLRRESEKWKQQPRDSDLILLAGKYEMKIVQAYAQTHFKRACEAYKSPKELTSLLSTAEKYEMQELKKLIEDSSATFSWRLSYEELIEFDESRVVSMVKHPKFAHNLFNARSWVKEEDCKAKMFGTLVHYAREKKSQEIVGVLKGLVPKIPKKDSRVNSETMDKIRTFLQWIEEMLDGAILE